VGICHGAANKKSASIFVKGNENEVLVFPFESNKYRISTKVARGVWMLEMQFNTSSAMMRLLESEMQVVCSRRKAVVREARLRRLGLPLLSFQC